VSTAPSDAREERSAADAYLDRLGIPDRPDPGGIVWVTPELLEQVLPEVGLIPQERSSGAGETTVVSELDGFALETILRGDIADGRGPRLVARASFVLERAVGLAWANAWNARGALCAVYLDADGDPVLQATLDTGGGVTLEGLHRFLHGFVAEVAELLGSL
jgi:hypothetical protein